MSRDDDSEEYEERHDTTRSEDREAFVPEEAEPFIDPDGPTPGYALFGNLYLTDDAIYSTGVHCRRCGCGVARIDRDSGVTSCPNCGGRPMTGLDPAEIAARTGVLEADVRAVLDAVRESQPEHHVEAINSEECGSIIVAGDEGEVLADSVPPGTRVDRSEDGSITSIETTDDEWYIFVDENTPTGAKIHRRAHERGETAETFVIDAMDEFVGEGL